MKLTKKDRNRLQSVLDNLKRGIGFVMAKDTALMRTHRMGSCDFFASTYPDYAGQKWGPINKEVGSEFCLALTAMRDLDTLLTAPEKPLVEVENA